MIMVMIWVVLNVGNFYVSQQLLSSEEGLCLIGTVL